MSHPAKKRCLDTDCLGLVSAETLNHLPKMD